ncbi:MAG: winged helix-turn-helix domain-containing protein [Phototrophicaceae bacterium]
MEPRPSVLLIGRLTLKGAQWVEALEKRYANTIVTSGKSALDILSSLAPRVVVWDSVSLRTHGDRSLKQIRDAQPAIKLIRIAQAGAKTASTVVDGTITAPITARKLTNHIQKLVNLPAEEVVSAGVFSMQVQRRLLTVNGHELLLNPKLAALLEMFIRHANQTVERATLMNVVWQTDYIGDMRTLDVHISKVRELLKKADAAQHLRTVRGVGYRLEVEAGKPTDT